MLLTSFAIVGAAVMVLAVVLHVARNVAQSRQTRKRAHLIRLRLQDDPSAQRVVYRKIQIRLSGS